MAAEKLDRTIIVGAGQAGLAAAFHLRAKGISCRILEAADSPGASWLTRWDSLTLFTPAHHCSLPGSAFPGPPGSFPSKDQMAAYLRNYATGFEITTGVRVTAVHRHDGAFKLETSAGQMSANHVVIATGATSTPYTPTIASTLAPELHQLHSMDYKSPQELPQGGVLVVGAGTSGMEIAVELATQRQVWLAGRVPFHVPDVALKHAGGLYWHFIHRVLTRRTPLGKKIAQDFTAHGGPLISVSIADAHQAGVVCLPRLEHLSNKGLPVFDGVAQLPVSTVLWATGYEPRYSWIDELPVDKRGWPVTNRGAVPALPGLYFVGLPFQYGLTSSLVGGVGRDAAHIAALIARAQDSFPADLAPSGHHGSQLS